MKDLRAFEEYYNKLKTFDSYFYVWFGKGSWKRINEIDIIEILYNDEIHREQLINELIFELDVKNGIDAFQYWNEIRAKVIKFIGSLKSLGFAPLLFTSGRLFHIHVFINPALIQKIKESKSDIFNFVSDNYSDVIFNFVDEINIERALIKLVHKFIAVYLIDKTEINDENIFFDLNLYSTKKHLIRAEGSINPKTKAYKSFISDYKLLANPNMCLVKEESKIEFPKIEDYFFSNFSLYYKLFLISFKKYVEPLLYLEKYKKEISKNIKTNERKNKIEWIEKLLKTPLSDGRKRCINLIFAPYLVNVCKMEEVEALATIMNWLNECDKLSKVKIKESYVLYQLRYAQRRNLKPLSKEKAKEILNDVEELKTLLY